LSRILLVVLALIGSLSVGEVASPARTAPAGAVLDARELAYVEDEAESAPRVVADVRATLAARGDGRAELALRAAAVGEAVDPPPGPRGMRGGNRITARELAALERDGAAELLTRDADGAAVAHGTLATGRRGRVPERRVLPDGRFAWDDAGGPERLLELAFASGPLAPGTYRTELRVDGDVRLVAEWGHDGCRGRILSLVAMGAVHAEAAP
jgi:hypothetical protein